MVHVMYYRFIFELTRINLQERFPFLHYIILLTLFLVMAIWDCRQSPETNVSKIKACLMQNLKVLHTQK